MARQKGQIRIEIMQLFLENPEKIITTREIASEAGIHKSVVSRELKVLTEQLQITKLKAGQYQLADFGDSSKWSQEDNKRLIDRMLNYLDEKIPELRRSVLLAFMRGEIEIGIAMMQNLTRSADVLLSRWAKVNKGYDANPEQARQDTKLALAKERQLSEPEEEEEDNRVRAWDTVNKKFLD